MCTPRPSPPHQQQQQHHDIDIPSAHNHNLIHLIQCPRCSLPLRTPVRLPCGNTVCRECLPPTRPRARITYPASEGRDRGFECFFSRDQGAGVAATGGCVGEHCVGDCGADVLMTGLVGVFEEVLGGGGSESISKSKSKAGEGLGGRVMWRDGQEMREDEFQGCGGLGGIYELVKDGRMGYGATEVQYADSEAGEEGTTLEELSDAIRSELDCHVCYSLILDPLTTPCGHTFCRRCVAGILNHSDLCPVCRRKLNMLSNLQAEPANKRVAELIERLFPDQIASRREALAREDPDAEEKPIPLFVCTLSFPGMPTFLHVYERRYRVMMRRVMEFGAGRFGMVAYNRGNWAQGDMGRTPFMQYGTLLQVERFERLPDGRSLVIAKGVSRFRVTKSERNEGYHVGRTDRVDDVSLMEEEALESREVSNAAGTSPLAEEQGHTRLEAMSTQELFELGVNFVRQQRKNGAGWLHPRVLMAYGNLPTDPAQFPWWLASVLPVAEEEKYALLSTTSVRERLKITARWVQKLEARRWYVYIKCRPACMHLHEQVNPGFHCDCFMTSRPSPHLRHCPVDIRAVRIDRVTGVDASLYIHGPLLLLRLSILRVLGLFIPTT